MEFNGPDPADLADVRSLNIAFLRHLHGPQGAGLRDGLPATLRNAVLALTERHLARLADVPFLLLSLNELDDAYWRRILTASPVRDLFSTHPAEPDPLQRIASATLAFLWQLSRRNAYATRLVCGASMRWCEQLAECTLFDVILCATDQPNLVRPRLGDNPVFWQRLLGAGLSSQHDIRRAAHLRALQTILTPETTQAAQTFRSAACYSSVPTLERRAAAKLRDRK